MRKACTMFPKKKLLALVMTFFVTKKALGYMCTYYANDIMCTYYAKFLYKFSIFTSQL